MLLKARDRDFAEPFFKNMNGTVNFFGSPFVVKEDMTPKFIKDYLMIMLHTPARLPESVDFEEYAPTTSIFNTTHHDVFANGRILATKRLCDGSSWRRDAKKQKK